MLQMHLIGYDTRDLYVPTNIQKLVINPMLHTWKLQNAADDVETKTDDKCSVLQLLRSVFA